MQDKCGEVPQKPDASSRRSPGLQAGEWPAPRPARPDFGRYVITHVNHNQIIYPPDGGFAMILEDVGRWVDKP